MLRALLIACLGVAIASSAAAARAATPGIEATYAAHTRGVELARAGHYDEGLKVLLPLLARFPNEYPLVRDVVLINTWKGDCDGALLYFRRIRDRPTLDDYLIGPVANCAVVRGRAGDYSTAIGTLSSLLPHARDAYPLRRDLAVITQWKGDCPGALARFAPIRDDPRNPPYLIAPMADCLRRENRPIESLALIESALARYPTDATLLHERDRAEVALRLDRGLYDERRELWLRAASANSDRDVRELTAAAEGSASVAAPLRVYARYLNSQAGGAAFDAGEMHRIGVGLRWRPSVQLAIDQGFSNDIYQTRRDGVHTRIAYQPYDPWKFSVGRDTYAEDISVRARAAGIEATHRYADVEYSGLNYVWSWYGIVSGYDYTDGNRRGVFYTTLGYAYALLPEREQRIFIEWYRSHNSLDNAVYFNPKHDESFALVHRTAFVFDTRFRRHVDTLALSVGSYAQEGFGRHTTYGASYEQDYDFDDRRNLILGAGYSRNYFDGGREDDWRLTVQYRWRF